MVYLTRRYRFSAAHRLHSEALSVAENQSVYGKCNNPYGHGHNYVLEVTVAGRVNQATGMVMDLGILDGVVQREILDRFAYSYLNQDREFCTGQVPTTENLCKTIFNILRPRLKSERAAGQVHLWRVRMEETTSNFFECYREGEATKMEKRFL